MKISVYVGYDTRINLEDLGMVGVTFGIQDSISGSMLTGNITA